MKKFILYVFFLIIYFTSIAHADTVKWINKNSYNNDDRYIELETTNTSGYLKYTNQVYGYTIFVPEIFDTVKYFKLLEGCRFEKDLVTSFTVGASDNVLNKTLEERYQDDLVFINKKDIKYTEFGDNWYILIWADNINANYKKVFVQDNCITDFKFICPSNKYGNYSETISMIVSNFTPANKKDENSLTLSSKKPPLQNDSESSGSASLESKPSLKGKHQYINSEKTSSQIVDNTNNIKSDNFSHKSSKNDSISNNDFAFGLLIVSSIYLIYLFYKMTRPNYKKEPNEFLEAFGAYFFTLFSISILILGGLLSESIVLYIVVFVGSQWIYEKIIEKINKNK